MEETKKQINDLISSREFLSLEEAVNQFNIFTALGLEKKETRHSRFLAYLLNPKETHRMEDLFVKEFLKEIYPNEKIFIDGKSFYNLEVKVEVWADKNNRLDILLINPEEQSFYAIEHKIGAKEGKKQLQRYKEILSNKYKGYKGNFIFLTPEGKESSQKEDWIDIGYEKILLVIDRILEFYDYQVPKELLDILKQYKTTIEREILMTDKELENLCEVLYSNHKKAIDYIFNYINTSNFSNIFAQIKEALQQYDKEFSFYIGPSKILISHKDWKNNPSLQKPTSKLNLFNDSGSYLGILIERYGKGLCCRLLLAQTEENKKFRSAIIKAFNKKDSPEWKTLDNDTKFITEEDLEKSDMNALEQEYVNKKINRILKKYKEEVQEKIIELVKE